MRRALARTLRFVAFVLFAILIASVFVGFFALRDTPARSLVGEHHTVTSGEAEIEYSVISPVSTGSPRRSVALLPSYARSASDFNELMLALPRHGYRTIAMQPRGIEGSTLPSLEPTLATYAADLAAVLDAEQIHEPVVVVGHAYGNRVARAFATNHPERVRSLILLAAGGDEPTSEATGAALTRAVFPIFPEKTRRAAIQRAFFAKGHEVPDLWMQGWYPLAALAEAHATTASPSETWAHAGNAPILILEPAQDFVAAGAGERLRARFPDRVRLEFVADAGHAILNEQAEFVERRILEELETIQW